MKVLLTGAMGNIGYSTLKGLLAEGHDVVAFDLESKRARKLASGLDERVRVVWGDITDRDGLRQALDGVDAVIHLAAIIPPLADRAPELAQRVNVDATLGLIAEMEASPTAKRLIFASSMGIFGDVQDREPPLRVDTPVSPTDEYGRQKIKCEEAIRASGLQWSILRLAAVTPIQLQVQDPSILFEFSPDARMEFLHPDDAGTAFARAVACAESIGKVLYLGGGANCQTTYLEFATALMKTIGIGPVPIDAFPRTTPPRFYGDWLDTEESQRLLGFQSRGIDEQIADMKKHFGLIAPLVRLVRPLATWFVVRKSPFLAENRR
ncbi:NAD(P)-dependent oxidoreductase [Aldersonia sp. NBC_00410]|uniref:NAD-dependent epimerase/dehydratase family protein n=1 Tax=Aldersonia sp. NBC_00410 TaxID=2975954 RepID=UPI002258AC65|nr:NAD(P)-dependent oxidoreductase [Aldersonia sp. NBC_00410]MCX5044724.1 NAD(P)-dependent oxidoreductase [Aldersonia sp. NBC_00410]